MRPREKGPFIFIRCINVHRNVKQTIDKADVYKVYRCVFRHICQYICIYVYIFVRWPASRKGLADAATNTEIQDRIRIGE